MKKIIYSTIAIFAITVSISAFNSATSEPTGAPAGKTGSPGDGGATCQASGCHSGAPTVVPGIITSNVPITGYVGGTTYSITVTTSGTGNKGFQVSPQDLTGKLLGTLIAGSGQKLVGGGKYVTHTTPKTSATATWTFQWIAPVAGTGDITFYGAFAITDKSTKKSTLVIPEFKTVMPSLTSFMPMMARKNDTITILGQHFDTVLSVSIGGVSAKSYSVLNDSTIEAIVDSCSNGIVVVTTTTGEAQLGGFVFVPTTVGIQFNQNNLLSVYPNPSSDYLFIKNIGVEKITKVEIYNANAQLISTPKFSNTIDITSLSAGKYFVLISTATSTYKEVIIKK